MLMTCGGTHYLPSGSGGGKLKNTLVWSEKLLLCGRQQLMVPSTSSQKCLAVDYHHAHSIQGSGIIVEEGIKGFRSLQVGKQTMKFFLLDTTQFFFYQFLTVKSTCTRPSKEQPTPNSSIHGEEAPKAHPWQIIGGYKEKVSLLQEHIQLQAVHFPLGTLISMCM